MKTLFNLILITVMIIVSVKLSGGSVGKLATHVKHGGNAIINVVDSGIDLTKNSLDGATAK
jgi:hypothetical protein